METLSDLRKFMNDHLSLSELRTLCFDLDIDYDNLSGENKNDKIISAIKKFHRASRLAELIDYLAASSPRSKIDWQETSQIFHALQRYDVASAEFEGEARLPAPFQAPSPPSNFIHRQENEELVAIVGHDRPQIIRAYGLIGTGKTALASQAAHTLRDRFPDGVIWLRGQVNDLETDLRKTAKDFGQVENFNLLTDLGEKIDFVRQLLAPRQLLVVLDGLESEGEFGRLLTDDRSFLTLVTTRDQMLLKDIATQEIPVSTFSEEESLQYLVYSIGRERVEAEPDEARQLHNLVGGLPLALNIVGGMLSESMELKIGEYNQMLIGKSTRLERLTDWLDSSNNNILASFELSYRTLPESLQLIFNSLATFSGLSFTSQAVAAVNKVSLPQAKLGLGRLARLSLIQYEQHVGRYKINALVQSFALRKCGSDIEQFNQQAIDYYLNILQEEPAHTLDKILQEEWTNLFRILALLFEKSDWDNLTKSTLSLTQFDLGSMGFLERQGYWQEARQLLNWTLDAGEALIDQSIEIQLRLNATGFALLQNDTEAAKKQLDKVEAESLVTEISTTGRLSWAIVQWHDLRSRILLQEGPQLAISEMDACLEALIEISADATEVQRGYVYGRLVPLYGRMGQLDKAGNAAQRALDLLPPEPSSAQINLWSDLNIIYRLKGNLEESLQAGQKAESFAESLNAIDRLPGIWNNLGQNQEQAGALTEAITNYTRGRSLAKRLGNGYLSCGLTLSLGRVYLMLGEDLLATKMFEETLSVARTDQFRDLEALTLSNLVDLQIATDLLDQADDKLSQAQELTVELEMGYLKPTLFRQHAQLLGLSNQMPEAFDHIEQAIALAKKSQDKLELGIAYRVKGENLSRDGRVNDAITAFRESESTLKTLSDYEWARTLLSLVDHILQDPGTASRAAPILDQARKVFAKIETRRELQQTDALLQQINS